MLIIENIRDQYFLFGVPVGQELYILVTVLPLSKLDEQFAIDDGSIGYMDATILVY